MKTAIVPFLLLLNVLVAVNAQTKDSVILVKDSITVKLLRYFRASFGYGYGRCLIFRRA
jgi:hypothetical protein